MAPSDGTSSENDSAAGETPRRLFVYNGGFLTQGRVRRILSLSGYDIRLGRPGPDDMVGVWGQSPSSPRGEAVAACTDTPILRVEDAFLRSVLPGRDGEPPLGLILDSTGVHFDGSAPSDLEILLATHPLDDPGLLSRASLAMARLQRGHLSKYNAFDPALPGPPPNFVLVIDQTRGDASVRASGADETTFCAMLAAARAAHPGVPVVIKSHPETTAGHRPGHFTPAECDATTTFLTDPISPWTLLAGASAVYTVSSQLGFEAILAGHRPHVWGQPFYAGWGLSHDRHPNPRRARTLTRPQLFATAMILYPRWYDPVLDRLCSLEDAIATLEAETRAWREDHRGWVATGMRLWKQKRLQSFFGGQRPVRFIEPAPKAIAAAKDHGLMVWSNQITPDLDAAGACRLEDGFLRSCGLGADLIPPLSLCLDDLGIYYDPTCPSRLDALIAASTVLPEDARTRADRLILMLTKEGLSKYNLDGAPLPLGLPAGRRILVPGQVEDDASIRHGAADIRTNRALLEAARKANPAAVILYKPHPDVEAGLRPGIVPDAATLADAVLDRTNPIAALSAVEQVWTITSTLGFEALLRGKRVTCLGHPFYAGWGLTDDRAGPLPRRTARPDLTALAHAVLIDYPRYFDPVTRRPCPPEAIVHRLATGTVPEPSRANRSLAKLQGLLAGQAHLWRKKGR
ncbi:MAG: capsular polysaccharide biosynthesis protein [Rhodobacterales bacterium]|nr:capsular polysaccharide biosynthesis protein [Rhodobacterales bacterium]